MDRLLNLTAELDIDDNTLMIFSAGKCATCRDTNAPRPRRVSCRVVSCARAPMCCAKETAITRHVLTLCLCVQTTAAPGTGVLTR